MLAEFLPRGDHHFLNFNLF